MGCKGRGDSWGVKSGEIDVEAGIVRRDGISRCD